MFWKKKKEITYIKKETPAFFEWAVEKEFFSSALSPDERTQTLLVEIQKRSMAEQVLLLTWNANDKTSKILNISPINEKPFFSPKILSLLMSKGFSKKTILMLSDFNEDRLVHESLKRYKCSSLILSPLNIHTNYIDAILLIDYSSLREETRVLDFISFVSSVLALSIQNTRLFRELKKKRTELNNWVKHVEERIEEGTKNLLEKEFQYHVLFEGTNDGIIIHDSTGQLIEINRVACQLLGYERKELLQLTWKDITIDKAFSEQENYLKVVFHGQKTKPLETILKRKDNTVFEAELSSRKVWFQGKEVFQSFIRDVEVRKALEESLRESKEKYRLLVESSLIGVFIIRQGKIQFVNSKFADFLGYNRDELIEKDFFEFIAPEDRSMVVSRENQREKGEEVVDHYEVRFIKKGDEKLYGELRSCQVEMGGEVAVLGNVVDITKRKKLEIQLFESQKMESIGTLAGGIAHDFNNLLGGILGYASLLLSDMPSNHIYYNDIHTIAETAKRAADLTNRLLAFARGGKYHVRSIDLNQNIEEIITALYRTIDKSIIIETSLGKNLWWVKGDSKQIYQAIMNICLNSVEAMSGGGKLTIGTANVILDETFSQTQLGVQPGDYIRIAISDTGVGMDEKTKNRIFEPFFTTKPAGEGTGLGLAMVYGIIKNHEGAILVDSELGKGTKVSILLPRFQEVNEEIHPVSVSESSEKNIVLLVDDEQVIRQVGKRMLEKGGYEVLLASNGKEALEIYNKNRENISLVVLDLIMPEMGGKEAFKKLRETNPNIKVIFTSGYGPYNHHDLEQFGDVVFIQKPFQTEVLLQAVRKIV